MSNTDGPSRFDEYGNFVFTLPDYEEMVARIRKLETMLEEVITAVKEIKNGR